MTDKFQDLSKAFVPLTLVISIVAGVVWLEKRLSGIEKELAVLTVTVQSANQLKATIERNDKLYMDHIQAIREALARKGIEVN